MNPAVQNPSIEKLRYIIFLYIILRFAPFPAFHNNFSFKVKVTYVENLLKPNISYPMRSDSSAHPTQEIRKTAIFPVFLDYFYCSRIYYYYYYYYYKYPKN